MVIGELVGDGVNVGVDKGMLPVSSDRPGEVEQLLNPRMLIEVRITTIIRCDFIQYQSFPKDLGLQMIQVGYAGEPDHRRKLISLQSLFPHMTNNQG